MVSRYSMAILKGNQSYGADKNKDILSTTLVRLSITGMF